MLGLPSRDLVSLFDANEARIERAGVRLLSYVGRGASTSCSPTDRSTRSGPTAGGWWTG